MSNKLDFRALAEADRDYVVGFRRELHMNPELSGEEVNTSRRIAEELKKVGIPYVVDAKRNVIGKLVGGKPGKRIAIRGDFDALPVKEETGLPYASKVEGVMHACGHDGHAAGLLGIARMFASIKDELPGTYYFCFQMGEETNSGAIEVVQYLESEGGVDLAIGAHLMPKFYRGNFFISEGAFMAGCMSWRVVVHGRGGHGSSPWASVDPIRPAADILMRLTSLPVNKVNPFETLIVSPCKFQAGTADNIIPETAEIAGTMRFFKNEHLTEVPDLMEKITKEVAESYGCTAEFIRGVHCMPVINDNGMVKKAKALAAEMGFEMYDMPPATGSDNFGEYLYKFGGFYVFGCDVRPDAALVINHNPKFDIDENAMLNNVSFLAAFAHRFNSGAFDE